MYEFNRIRRNLGLCLIEPSIEGISSYLYRNNINPSRFLNADINFILDKEQKRIESKNRRSEKKTLKLNKKQLHIDRLRESDRSKSKGKKTSISEGWVYVIQHPAFSGWIKIGSAINAEDRLNIYQVYCPERSFTLVSKIYCKDRISLEKQVQKELDHCRGNGEWFKVDKIEAVNLIKRICEMMTEESGPQGRR